MEVSISSRSQFAAPSTDVAPVGAPDTPTGRRLTANFLVLTGGECVAKVLTFAAFAYLARILGPAEYGHLEFVLAAMVFFTLPVDLGLGNYGARELARRPHDAAILFSDITALRLLLAFASFAALLVVTALLSESMETKLLLILYGLSLFGFPAVTQWFFQGKDQMHWVAAISITRQAVFTALVFLFLHSDMPLYYIGMFECASVTAAVGLSLLLVGRKLLRWPQVKPATLGQHLRKALPIGMSQLAWAFLWYFATVLLALMVAGDALGWFGAAHRIIMALHTFIWLYFFNLLPSLSRFVFLERERMRTLIRQSLEITLWAGLFAALTGALFGAELLALAFGPEFVGAGRPLAVMIWILPLAFLSGHYKYTLIAANLQTLDFYFTLAAAVAAIVLALLLIPLYGAMGAAVALLSANVLSLALLYYGVEQHLHGMHLPVRLAAPVLTTAASVGVFVSFGPSHGVLARGAALILFVVSAGACGCVRLLAANTDRTGGLVPGPKDLL